MTLRYATIIFTAAVMAATIALGVSAAQPQEAGAADTVKVKGCTGTSITLEAREKRILVLHNKMRAGSGLPRLCVHPALQKAAEAHSRDMIELDYFSHETRSTGATFAQRINREGYRYHTAGENIAWGSGSYSTPGRIFEGWMNSSGHRKNILTRGYHEVGIGAATSKYRNYGNATMWTADFGARS